MGTNYYLRHNICDCCNRYDELHIGKSSYKWKFLFNAAIEEYLTTDLITYDQWVDFLKVTIENDGWKIFDEYGREIELEELLSLVAGKQCDKTQESNDNYVDIRGYNFATREFS